MRDYLFPGRTFIGSKNEDDYKVDIKYNCHQQSTFLFSFDTSDDQGEKHKLAIDLYDKEIWEYYDWEQVSPVFPRESECKAWGDQHLPRENEQMSIEDYISG